MSKKRVGAMRKYRGFTLIEVLIALIVLSVGMLGIAGLYVHSMQAGRTSMFRHHAVTLAGDVAERIRANPRAGAVYAGSGANNQCVAADRNCSSEQMAQNDIFTWSQQAGDTLPDGAVSVSYNGGLMPPEYRITVSWSEAGQEPPPSYTISIRAMEI
jgi:type IV pilus assembly protein PilV